MRLSLDSDHWDAIFMVSIDYFSLPTLLRHDKIKRARIRGFSPGRIPVCSSSAPGLPVGFNLFIARNGSWRAPICKRVRRLLKGEAS
jgi:hypothetical protein